MSNVPRPPTANYCIQCGIPLVLRRTDDRERQVCPACGWVYYPKANQASAVAILQDGWVLMVRRERDPSKDHWMLPSGFLEYGESPEEAAVREMKEELGVEVELDGLVDVLMERGDPRGHCLLVVYAGHIAGGRLQAGDDAAEARFFPLDQPPEQIAFEVHRRALDELKDLQIVPPGS